MVNCSVGNHAKSKVFGLLIGSGRPKAVLSVKKSQHIDLLKDNSLLALAVSNVCALEFNRTNNLSGLNGTGKLTVSSNLNCIMK